MRDQRQTKMELLNELSQLRARVAQLEKAGIEHERTNEALCASRLQLSDAMDLAHIVYWEVDPATGEFIFNDPFYAFYATTAEREGGYRMPREEYGKRFVHPDDVWLFKKVAEKRAASHELEFLYDVEHRINRRDGKVRHILARVRVSRDAAGHTIKYYGANQDITERKQAREAVLKSEATYRALFGNMLDGIAHCEMVFDNDRPVDFIYLDVNDAFERLTGLEDVVGKKVTEVIPGIRDAHPELFEIYGRVVLTGKPEKFEIDFRLLKRWFSVSVYRTEKNRFVAAFDNITDRKQAEEALRESESRFKGAFETSAIGMAIVSLDGRYLQVNQSLCLSVGYAEQELLNGTFPDITHPDDLENDQEYRRRLLRDDISYYHIEKRYFHKDGYVVWGLLSVSLVRDARGYPLYFVSQVEDITERKLLEEKLQTRSVTDELTGLYNRRGFFELCQEKLSIASRRNEKLLFLFADLDYMKWINDTLGHDEGDAALVAVARILRDTFRGSDIIGRIGGDEFAILAVGPSEDAENTFLARLQDNLTTFNKTNDRQDFPISVSVGISGYEPSRPCSLETLIAQADQRMYEVKREKKRSRSYHAGETVARGSRNSSVSGYG